MADRVLMLRATDTNGDIVPGARAYFYLNNTSTPVDVYTDARAETVHPSPVLADADGVFPDVFTTVALKLIVQDADGVTLPGYPSNNWHISPTVGTAAELVAFAPITGNPSTDVQAAIAVNTELWNTVTPFSRGALEATTDSGWRDELGLGVAATYNISNDGNLALSRTTHLTTERAVKVYADAVAVAARGWEYTSGEQAIAAASTLTLTHGLDAAPTRFGFALRCKTAEHNYAVGDEVQVSGAIDDVGSTVRGPICIIENGNTTEIKVLIPDAFVIADKTTYARGALTAGNWRLIVRASR